MDQRTEHVRWAEIINQKYGMSLFIICFGVTLHAMDELVVATMLPAIVSEIGGLYLISWTISVYEIGTVVFSALSGLATTRYGVRGPMLCSAVLFGLGCIINALSPNMEIVLLGRLFQGFGGGGLLAISLVASAVLFPQRTLARVMGVISVFWGSVGFLGPLLGSIFVDFLSWRIGFWCFGAASFILSVLILAKIKNVHSVNGKDTGIGYPVKRIIAITIGIFMIAAAGIEVTTVKSSLLIILGIFCIGIFLVLDSHQTNNRMLPQQPLNVFKPIGSAFTIIVCFSAATVALSIYGALILKSLHGTSVLAAGYIIACPSIGWAMATIFVSGLPAHLDQKMIKWGFLIASLGIAGFVYAVPHGPDFLVGIFAFVEGVGFGIAWAFIPRLVRHMSPAAEIERNTGAVSTAQAIGYALGAAYIGIVGNWSGVAESTSEDITYFSATTIFLACVPLSVLGLISMRRFVYSMPVPD